LRGILPSWAACIYIRQPAPLGLGHAVLCARPVVGQAPFFVHLADDLIDAQVPVLEQMARAYEARGGGSFVGVQTVEPAETDKYGIVATGPEDEDIARVERIVEKPKPADAPSQLAVVGRYLLSPTIFDKLERVGRGAGGEIQLTDGIAALLTEEPVYAYRFAGKRYDCGSKLGYLEATVEFGLKHPSLGPGFAAYLRSLTDRLDRP
jgi:UTP--glucose-1-phosphate uridylyltransferase